MENVFMRYFRSKNSYTKKQVARKLGITVHQYGDIENGLVMLTHDQAKVLGKSYGTDWRFFLESALQLDLLHTRGEVIKLLNVKNKRLEQAMEKEYEIIHNVKQLEGQVHTRPL